MSSYVNLQDIYNGFKIWPCGSIFIFKRTSDLATMYLLELLCTKLWIKLFLLGIASTQDIDISESEEAFESEFKIKYHTKEEEERAGKTYTNPKIHNSKPQISNSRS